MGTICLSDQAVLNPYGGERKDTAVSLGEGFPPPGVRTFLQRGEDLRTSSLGNPTPCDTQFPPHSPRSQTPPDYVARPGCSSDNQNGVFNGSSSTIPTANKTKRIAGTGPRAHAQLAGLDRSFHRTGLIMVPNASRPIIIRKKTRDTKRKNAPRISANMLTHLLLFHRPF